MSTPNDPFRLLEELTKQREQLEIEIRRAEQQTRQVEQQKLASRRRRLQAFVSEIEEFRTSVASNLRNMLHELEITPRGQIRVSMTFNVGGQILSQGASHISGDDINGIFAGEDILPEDWTTIFQAGWSDEQLAMLEKIKNNENRPTEGSGPTDANTRAFINSRLLAKRLPYKIKATPETWHLRKNWQLRRYTMCRV